MAKGKGKFEIDWDDAKAVARLAKVAKYLASQELARANAAALNRAGVSAGAEWRKAITAESTVKSSKVREAFKDRKASPARGVYTITVFGDRKLTIKEFGKINQTKTGVSVKLWKRGKKSVIRGAFIVDVFGSNAFVRQGRERGPLKQLYGPSPKVLASGKEEAAQNAFQEMYLRRIAHEINFRVSKANR